MYIDILFKIERVAMPRESIEKGEHKQIQNFTPARKRKANKGEVTIKTAMINVCL